MLADNSDAGGDFPADSDDLTALIPQEYTVEKIYLSQQTIGDARQSLLDGINSGAALVNYLGHAGMDRFAQEGLLQTDDMGSLSNGDKLPIVIAMSCVVGRYELPGYDSLGEALVMDQDGGAIAVWAPTGLSMNVDAKFLNEDFIRANIINQKETLGMGVLDALQAYSARGISPVFLQIYTLLGDPALQTSLLSNQH